MSGRVMRHKVDDFEVAFIKLIQRSANVGGNWRVVTDVIWPLVEQFEHKELLEIDEANKRVRLSERGEIVAEYIL